MRLWLIGGGAVLIALIIVAAVVFRTAPTEETTPTDGFTSSCTGRLCFFDGVATCTPSWTAWSYWTTGGDDQFTFTRNITVTPGKGGCLVTAQNSNLRVFKRGPDGKVALNSELMHAVPSGCCTIAPERLGAIFTAARKQGEFSSDAALFCPILTGQFPKDQPPAQ